LTSRAEPDADALAALYGMAAARCVGGDFAGTEELGTSFLARADDPRIGAGWEMLGLWTLGTAAWHRGRNPDAIAHLGRALRLADEADPALLAAFVQDPAVSIGCFLSAALSRAGRRDEATAQIEAAMGAAEQSGDPFTTVFALWFRALLATFRDDVAEARSVAARARALSVAHGYGFWTAMAGQLESWATVRQPRESAERAGARVALRDHFESYTRSGARMLRPLFCWLLADAELLTGHPTAALRYADDGISFSATTGEELALDRLMQVRSAAAAALSD
jgi:tetratricopeptide (TPR) repeat protein